MGSVYDTPSQDNTRYNVEAEKTLHQILSDSEEKLHKQRVANQQTLVALQLAGIKEVNKLSLAEVVSVADKRKKLQEEYAEMVEQGLMDEEEAAKKVQDNLTEYTKQMIVDRKSAALKSIEDEWKAKKKRIDDEIKYLDKTDKKAAKAKKKELKKEEKEAQDKTYKDLMKGGMSRVEAAQVAGKTGVVTASKAMSAAANTLLNGLKQMFDSTIQTYGQYQQKINTRLQGSGYTWNNKGIEYNLSRAVGTTPWLKTQALMDNVVKATEQGIAFNIEQRAFLQTISESIATTFDAFDSNLMRIVRLQQADSTAARLGMEAGLTSFFNSFFQDTSYLNNSFDTVSANLIEATSQMTANEAVAFEYQVQKWLGSLASVGFGDTALSAISQALGYLGSGNVSALASSGAMQNLLVMAANRAGLNYSSLLTSGLEADTTNKLLESMVNYLEEIAESDNKVVKSQYAQIFGMSVSDLTAVKNLSSSTKQIAKSSMNYLGAIDELYSQMGQLSSRISIGGMMENLFSNVNYSIGSTIAGNPVTYALWQITSMIEDLTGGIALPTFSVMGNMVDLNTTVTNLMRAGIVGVSTLGAIGDIISGIGNTANPSNMLSKLNIGNKLTTTRRGSGLTRAKVSKALSSSTFVGNTAGEDYYDASVTQANETIEDIKAENEATEIMLQDIHEYMLQVFDPKMTEIERLVALLAGYNVSDTSWKTYTNSSGDVYGATKVTVDYEHEFSAKSAALESINTNVASIAALLQAVVDGDALNVKLNNAGFGTGWDMTTPQP